MSMVDDQDGKTPGIRAVLLAALIACGSALAQDAEGPESAAARADEIDALEPGVDTSAPVTPGDDEVVDPGEPSAVLAADVSRSRSSGQVMDRLDLGTTEITGNQELPKVMYIVPWQQPEPGELVGKPVNTLLDEVLAPIDREEFVRQIDYFDDLYGEDGE